MPDLTKSLLLLSCIVLVNLRHVHTPPEFEVLSPSEFNVILSPEEDGMVRSVKISINEKNYGIHEPDFEQKNVEGRLIKFSAKNFNLTKGDTIYYFLAVDDGNQGVYKHVGSYVFDGVFKTPNRSKREVYENSFEDSAEQTNQNLGDRYTQPDSNRQVRHDHGPPHDYFHPHGPPRRHHHFGPHHFAPPPYGDPHDHRSYPGPGSWKETGYDRKDSFGGSGPWDDHEHCDSYGNNKPKYPGSDQNPGNRKPWNNDNNDRNNDRPFSTNNNKKNSGNPGSDNPYGSNKPNKGTSFGNDNSSSESDESDESTENKNNQDNKRNDNPSVEVFSTRRPSTTQRTTTVPNIDIRFRVPEER